LDGSLPHLQQQAPPSSFGVPGHDPMARFADASMSGDTEAFRQAARELCDTPQARAWLQAGRERLLALDTCRTDDQAKQMQDPAIEQHAGINPIEHGLVR